MRYLHVSGSEAPVVGTVAVPPSKYHAHRALLMASLAPGTSTIIGRNDARHVEHTIRALRALGTHVELRSDGYIVTGGPYVPRRPEIPLGSCGTLAYFIVGLGCLSERGPVTFHAEKQLRDRPIKELLDGLRELGVRLEARDDRLPVTVHPGRPRGGHVRISGVLSQWISGLIIAASIAEGESLIEAVGELNERHYIALTVRMLRKFGVHVSVSNDWRVFRVRGGQPYHPVQDLVLSSDVSSMAYPLVAACIHPADVLFTATSSCDDHPERAVFDALSDMGAPLDFADHRRELRVQHGGVRLHGTTIDCTDLPDALPVLCVAAALAEGRTVLENVSHARRKESDRVRASMQLTRMGARMRATEDRIEVEGVTSLRGAELSTFNDHRVLMSLAVAGTAANGVTRLPFANAYRISYPGFLDDMRALGLDVRVAEMELALGGVHA